MKTIIAGSRKGRFSEEDIEYLKEAVKSLGVTEIVSGGATGIDREAIKFANENGIPWKIFHADWDSYGRMAGPMRNQSMAEYADALIAFPGGKGTRNMVEQAKRRGLKVIQPKEAQ